MGAIAGALTAALTPPQCPPPTRPILLIGDSLAAGLAEPMGQLAEACGIVRFGASATIGSGVSAWDVGRWREALGMAGGQIAGGTVLISLGGNDFHADPVSVRRGIDRLLGFVADAGARPRWISPPDIPVDDRAGVRSAWRRAIGLGRMRGYYPTEEMAGRYPVSGDGIHPTPRGYAELARAIWRWVAIRQGE